MSKADELVPMIMSEEELAQHCKDNNSIAVESSPFCRITMSDSDQKELKQLAATREAELQEKVQEGWGEGFLRAVIMSPPKNIDAAVASATTYTRALLGLPRVPPPVKKPKPPSKYKGSYRKRMRAFTTTFGYARCILRLSQSKMQLFMPPNKKGGGKWQDPWEEWGDRVMKTTGIRLPGSWRTKRLAKKRRRALWRVCGGY